MGPAQRPWHISKTNFARLETFQWNLKFQCTVCGCGSVCKHVCVCLRVGCLCVFPGAGGAVPPQGSRPLSGNTSRNLSAPRGGARLHWLLTSCPWPHHPQIKATPWGPVTPELLRDRTSVLRKRQAMWASPGFTATCHQGCREMFDDIILSLGFLGGGRGYGGHAALHLPIRSEPTVPLAPWWLRQVSPPPSFLRRVSACWGSPGLDRQRARPPGSAGRTGSVLGRAPLPLPSPRGCSGKAPRGAGDREAPWSRTGGQGTLPKPGPREG